MANLSDVAEELAHAGEEFVYVVGAARTADRCLS
jgi:hypothetical protein